MLGRGEEILGLRQLHDAPDVHHRHAVTDVPHDAEIVRHEEVGQRVVMAVLVGAVGPDATTFHSGTGIARELLPQEDPVRG